MLRPGPLNPRETALNLYPFKQPWSPNQTLKLLDVDLLQILVCTCDSLVELHLRLHGCGLGFGAVCVPPLGGFEAGEGGCSCGGGGGVQSCACSTELEHSRPFFRIFCRPDNNP